MRLILVVLVCLICSCSSLERFNRDEALEYFDIKPNQLLLKVKIKDVIYTDYYQPGTGICAVDENNKEECFPTHFWFS